MMYYVLAAKTNLIDSILCIPNIPNEITFNINTFFTIWQNYILTATIKIMLIQKDLLISDIYFFDNNICIKVFWGGTVVFFDI